MTDSILTALHAWLLTCPLLQGAVLHLAWLPEQPAGEAEYALLGSAGFAVVRQYATRALCEVQFALQSVRTYAPDNACSAQTEQLFEALARWMEQQSRRGLLPQLADGRKAVLVRAESRGYLFEAAAGAGKYQIRCVMQYLQEGAHHG